MTAALIAKLCAIVMTVFLGWCAGRMRWLGPPSQEPSRVLSNAAFYLFVPALLFRTTARVDLSQLPWKTIGAFFVPTLATLFAVYVIARWLQRNVDGREPAAPSVRAITASFGNTVQVGIPIAAAVYGEAGLAIHVTLVSLHAVTLLTVLTSLVEWDLARQASGTGGGSLGATLATTLRNTLIHPVVLPVVAGMAWQLTGLPLPMVLDEALLILGTAMVPLCLTLIGLSLAYLGWPERMRAAIVLAVIKLVLLPAAVLAIAYYGFALRGLPLAIAVLISAMPVGSNALIFAQRYRTLESEATAAIVCSTVAFAFALPLWLLVLRNF